MQIKLTSISSAAAFCAAALLLTSNVQAGPFSGLRVIDAPSRGEARIQPMPPTMARSMRTNRAGADDRANHDAGDDRGVNAQPGDDRGHNPEPGDDRGGHHHRGGRR